MASGAPDYQEVFTLVAPVVGSGAPDWELTAVGPGGVPIGGGFSLVSYEYVPAASPVALNGSSSTTVLSVTGLEKDVYYLVVAFVTVEVTMTSASGWVALSLSPLYLASGFSAPAPEYAPGCTVASAYPQLVLTTAGYLATGTTLELNGVTDNGGHTTASVVGYSANGGGTESVVAVYSV